MEPDTQPEMGVCPDCGRAILLVLMDAHRADHVEQKKEPKIESLDLDDLEEKDKIRTEILLHPRKFKK
jgi:hypothetical protein